jgi:hypothetical protein
MADMNTAMRTAVKPFLKEAVKPVDDANRLNAANMRIPPKKMIFKHDLRFSGLGTKKEPQRWLPCLFIPSTRSPNLGSPGLHPDYVYDSKMTMIRRKAFSIILRRFNPVVNVEYPAKHKTI